MIEDRTTTKPEAGVPPTDRLQRALSGHVWSPWALFTGRCGVTPPPHAEITREEWEWMWVAVTKQQNEKQRHYDYQDGWDD